MKTKDEIDELYYKLYTISIDGEDNLHYYSFVDGYMRCQEDMTNKKYTEEDMIDAIIYGSSLTTSNVILYAHNYINSLNK